MLLILTTEAHTELKNIKNNFEAETNVKTSWESFITLAVKDFGDDRLINDKELKPNETISPEEMEKLIGDGNYN